MPGLQPGPGDPVGARRGRVPGAGGLLLPRCPQVQVILQQQPQHLPAPAVYQVLELGCGQAGRGGAAELAGQRREQIQ